jgi:hypothetical protein
LFGARAAFALVALLTNSLKGDKLWSVQYRANFQRLGFHKRMTMRKTIVSQPALAQLKYLTDQEKAALSEFVERSKHSGVQSAFSQYLYADELMDAERFVVRMERYLREVGATG